MRGLQEDNLAVTNVHVPEASEKSDRRCSSASGMMQELQELRSSQPFASSPPTQHNPFSFEDDDGDADAVRPDEVPIVLAEACNTIQSSYTGTVHARSSTGKVIRIGKRPRHLSSTRFAAEIDTDHSSKTKHYGIEIHAVVADAQLLDPRKNQEDPAKHVSTESSDSATHMWVDKYRPKKFTELLGDERTNREVMRWIKHWDYCVFGRPIAKELDKSRPQGETTKSDLQEPLLDLHHRPERKILMLTGPPGFGKTTLAHIAARQAGYNVIEVNASDDRTGAVVENKIGDALDSQAVFNPRPTLVVIDEIDGVSGSGGEAGFIRSLLKFIADDAKTTANNKFGPSYSGIKKKKGKKKITKALLRPIICICNDQYVAALRPLRPFCQIINFKPLTTPSVVARLRSICHNEGLQADNRALNALCEMTESDLRSCVNSLQYIRMKSKQFTLESVATTLAQRDTSKSSHSVVEAVFKLLDSKMESKKGRRNDVTPSVQRIADLAMTNNEYSKILNGCFAHYPLVPYHDNLFSKPSAASDWLFFYDQCERGVYERQHGELMAYMPYPVSAFHQLFATHGSKTNLDRSRADWEAREKLRINSELLNGWISGVKASLRQLFNPTSFATELISYGIRIIGTNLNPANAHLIKASDRIALSKVVDGMLCMGLQYTQYKVDDGSYIFRLEPPIQQVLNYEGVLQVKGESLLPARYAARQVISATLATEKIKRAMDAQGNIGTTAVVDAVENKKELVSKKRKAIDELPAQPAQKKDFFGRVIKQTDNISIISDSVNGADKQKSGVHIKFSDGFSDAVRNNISIKELLGLN